MIVDIAGFGVRFIRDRKTIWQTRAQVGKPYRQTPIFKSAIDHVVLNPTWTVPPTILDQDILPAVRRDRGYLARRGLEVIDRNGRTIPTSSIDFSRYTGRNFPYMIRQGAGDDNALGQVKILFPNPYLVYLHDTPSKALFEKDRRVFSSGCIRTERPLELVELLLADPARWNRGRAGCRGRDQGDAHRAAGEAGAGADPLLDPRPGRRRQPDVQARPVRARHARAGGARPAVCGRPAAGALVRRAARSDYAAAAAPCARPPDPVVRSAVPGRPPGPSRPAIC